MESDEQIDIHTHTHIDISYYFYVQHIDWQTLFKLLHGHQFPDIKFCWGYYFSGWESIFDFSETF